MTIVDLPERLPAPFVTKLYTLVNDSATDAMVSWSPGNNSFIVWKPLEWARDILPHYFKHENVQSFIRQLNTYGFQKADPDRFEYANPLFRRGQTHLLENIQRRRSKPHPQTPPQQQQTQLISSLGGPCVEVGQFRSEDVVERLMCDNGELLLQTTSLRQRCIAAEDDLKLTTENLDQTERGFNLLKFILSDDDTIPPDNRTRKRLLETEEENKVVDGQVVKPDAAQAEPMHELSNEIFCDMELEDNPFQGSSLFPELGDEPIDEEEKNVDNHFLGATLTKAFADGIINL